MPFKKHIALFLTFFMLVSNVGFVLNVHYCDNKIVSVLLNISSPLNLEERCCGAVEKSHCCKDHIFMLQKKMDQAIVQSFFVPWSEAVLPQQSYLITQTPQFFSQNTNVPAYYCDSNAPPLFKMYSQYIFYDQV